MGGLFSSIGDFLYGKEPKIKKIDNLNSGQKEFHSGILDQLKQMMQPEGGYNKAQNYFQSLLEPGGKGFENFASPYREQFNNKVLPGIAERFAGNGALSSSGFGQALGGASSDFESQLAQAFSGMQGEAANSQNNQFNQLGSLGLGTDSFANYEKPGHEGALIKLLSALAKSGMGGM
jgi:hypothetical protein